MRFGIVMYGGVSLAIYINGVTNELYEMVCATADAAPASAVAPAPAGRPDTRELYRRLAWLAGNADLRRHYADRLRARDGAPVPATEPDVWDGTAACRGLPTRLTVDVIAGTSAGGINGIFLAKALANGEPFSPLRQLWVQEGDIGALLNDGRSRRGLDARAVRTMAEEPASLLNSDRMYLKLLEAMDRMSAEGSHRPLVDEMDLFVTTTDIEGAPVALRLSDRVVSERRHKQGFRFAFAREGGNDLAPDANPFLAFAARCTSSFPFAFEPMTLAAAQRLDLSGRAGDAARWDRFFPNLPRDEVARGAHRQRAFGDGGYLDNKPFSHAVDALSRRYAGLPLSRKLMYIEPAPELAQGADAPPADPAEPPDALGNALAALISIPGYETIREDLQAVLARNRRIERVERILLIGERDIEREAAPFAGVIRHGDRIPDWTQLRLSEMVRYYGIAFLPYQRLRIYAVTDTLAGQLGAQWGVDPASDHQYALRALVRVWRERHYDDEGAPTPEGSRQTTNAFLNTFDVDYRVRRLGFLIRKADQLRRIFHCRLHAAAEGLAAGDDCSEHLSPLDMEVAQRMSRDHPLLAAAASPDALVTGVEAAHEALAALRTLRAAFVLARARLLARQQTTRAFLQDELRAVLNCILGASDAPPALAGADGQAVPVRLSAAAMDRAATSRNLQDAVFIRAQALMDAAVSARGTALQQALEASLDSLRYKTEGGGPTALSVEGARAWQLLGEPRLVAPASEDGRVTVAVAPSVAALFEAGAGLAEGTLADLDTPVGRQLRHFIGEYYLRFDSFDQMSFPLYYGTDTGEPATVDVVRVSPADATALVRESPARRKLAGTALGNFGAFLDRRWRDNDIMWGRLDGAERIIATLLPMNDADTRRVRAELTALAHRAILRESIVPAGHDALAGLLRQALAQMAQEVGASGHASSNSPASASRQEDGGAGAATARGSANPVADLLRRLQVGNSQQRDALEKLLASLLAEGELAAYVQRHDVDRNPDPEVLLDSLARGVSITGRVLEGISRRRGGGTPAARWMARLGLALQGLVMVSLPRTLLRPWWRHLMKVLYAFELTALLFALVLGSGDMRTLSVTALVVTLGVHLLTLVAADLMRGRNRWRNIALGGVGALVLALAVVGTVTLLRAWR